MNQNPLYVLIIRYFFMMLSLILLSGFWMFLEHTSLSLEGVMKYYAPKSFFGLLETVSPHLFGMGVALFIVTHFYAVIKGLASKKVYLVSIGVFLLIFLANVVGFFVEEGFLIAAVIKLLSTLFFIVVTFAMLLFVSIRLKA